MPLAALLALGVAMVVLMSLFPAGQIFANETLLATTLAALARLQLRVDVHIIDMATAIYISTWRYQCHWLQSLRVVTLLLLRALRILNTGVPQASGGCAHWYILHTTRHLPAFYSRGLEAVFFAAELKKV